MKRTFITSFFLIAALSLFSVNSRTHKIGKTKWLNEENRFEDVLKIAKEKKRPVLAVFSATWCGPCQMVKKDAFEKEEFKKIADKVILLYIEQTTKKGLEYCKKFNIKAYPTFKIFSEEGILLDTGRPERTVMGFSKWIDEVMSGNNFYSMLQKLKKDPEDRETLVNITNKMGWDKTDEIVKYLKKAIKIEPGFNDKISKKAYEKLIYYISSQYPYDRTEKDKKEYIKTNEPLIAKIIETYYPDNFTTFLKGNFAVNTIIEWYNKTRNYKKSLHFFEDFLKRKGKELNPKTDAGVIVNGIKTYYYSDKYEEGAKWIDYLIKAKERDPELMKSRNFSIYFSQIPFSILEVSENFINNKKIKKGKDLIYSFFDNKKFLSHFPKKILGYLYNGFAWAIFKAKVSDRKTLEIAKEASKISTEPIIKDTLASVHSQLGNYKRAIKIEKEILKKVKNEASRKEFSKKIEKWESALKSNGKK